jgi:hypothetical protein
MRPVGGVVMTARDPRDEFEFEAIEKELLVNTYCAEIVTDRRASLEADDRLELAGSRRVGTRTS